MTIRKDLDDYKIKFMELTEKHHNLSVTFKNQQENLLKLNKMMALKNKELIFLREKFNE